MRSTRCWWKEWREDKSFWALALHPDSQVPASRVQLSCCFSLQAPSKCFPTCTLLSTIDLSIVGQRFSLFPWQFLSTYNLDPPQTFSFCDLLDKGLVLHVSNSKVIFSINICVYKYWCDYVVSICSNKGTRASDL